MEFVRTENIQERLLLALTEKIDDNNRLINNLMKSITGQNTGNRINPLAKYKPPQGYDEIAEGECIKKEIEKTFNMSHHYLYSDSLEKICMIFFDSNLNMLKENGFEVFPAGGWSPRMYVVRWNLKREQVKYRGWWPASSL